MSIFASSAPIKRAVISHNTSGNNTLVAAVTGKKLVHVTPGTVESTDVFTLTVGNRSVSFTATASTVANVTAGLTTAWNAAASVDFTGVTASDETTHITLTGDTANDDFTEPIPTTTDGGGANTQTLVVAKQTDASRAKKIRVVSMYFMVAGTVTARFESAADGTEITGSMVFDKAGVLGPRDITLLLNDGGHFETDAADALNLELSGAVLCEGFLNYQEVE